MKKIHVLCAVFLIWTTATTAQSYVSLHPLEWIQVDVFKQKPDSTWNTATTGWRTDYGDSTFKTPGDSLALFSDTINSGDSHVIAGPTGIYTTFSILKYGQYLMIERKPWTSMKPGRYDTTQIYTGGSGGNYPGSYKFKFYCNFRSEHEASAVLKDQYLHTERVIGLRDTFEYRFTINASDAPDSGSKMPRRFVIITKKPLPVLPQNGPVHTPQPPLCSVYPNPVAQNGTLTISFKKKYERAQLVISSLMNGQVFVRKTLTGQLVQVPLPSTMVPGHYAVTVSTPTDHMVQKIVVQ